MKNILTIFLSVGVILSSCSEYYYYEPEPDECYLLTLENDSNKSIVWFIPYHENIDCSLAGELPESLEGNQTCSFATNAHARKTITIVRGQASPFESYHKDDIVPFYVFDADVFENTEWATIKQNKLWLAKYELSAQSVIEKDKRIRYTGE